MLHAYRARLQKCATPFKTNANIYLHQIISLDESVTELETRENDLKYQIERVPQGGGRR